MNDKAFFASVVHLIAELQDDSETVEPLRDPVRGPEVNLFDAGLLESLTVVRLLRAIETEFGVQVPVERYGMEDFFTLRSIRQVVEPLLSGS
ncbi:phosphopantetheine-binding protein [Streptomyces nojiriensis]|uniref:phosphopantetheine-binding protein n=1 Tax=Streptomyces nojiriensis TaxID=66374 RepID=UPI002E19BC55